MGIWLWEFGNLALQSSASGLEMEFSEWFGFWGCGGGDLIHGFIPFIWGQVGQVCGEVLGKCLGRVWEVFGELYREMFREGLGSAWGSVEGNVWGSV